MEKEARLSWWASLRATRPTDAGWALHYAAGFLLFAAMLTGRDALFAGASLLLALSLVGYFGAARAARSLSVEWEAPDRVFASEEFPLRVTVRNRGRAAVGGIEFFASPIEAAGEKPGAALARVPGRGGATLDLATRLRHRGRHRIFAPRVVTGWPFGLFRATLAPAGDRSVLVYPRRVPVPARALRSLHPEPAPRESAAAVPRGGELLRGVRPFAPGDSPRSIAWRASARHGRLLSREFEREDAGRAVVALDPDPRGLVSASFVRAEAVERACSLAASLCLRLRADGRKATLVVFAPDPTLVPSVERARGIARALETLALLEPPAKKDPPRDPLTLLPAGLLRGARVLLVTADRGAPRVESGPGGCEVLVIPAIRTSTGAGGAR